MTKTNPRPTYLEALKQRVLIFDGAMGTSIDNFTLTAEDFGGQRTEGNRDYLVITRPDVIDQIHSSFMEAGADVLETDTFQSTRLRLEEWGLADQTHAINMAAARLARGVADRYEAKDGRPRYVAGSLGPTGKLPSSDDPALSDVTFDQLSEIFREQALALIEGGADVLLVETSVDILEVKAALDGIRRAKKESGSQVAVQAQIFLDLSGRMLLGTEIPAVIATLEAMPVDVIGLNCSTGPEHMRDAIRYLCTHSRLPISCIHNAGLPMEVDGETVYPDGARALCAHPWRVCARVWRERDRRLLWHAPDAYRPTARDDRRASGARASARSNISPASRRACAPPRSARMAR